MEHFIGCDAHKKYSVFVAVSERGEASPAVRVGHDREEYLRFLQPLPSGSHIALEAGGHYYWMVDEMEGAGHYPRLAHPLEAKKRMGKTAKKTDKVDANGLGILLRNGTLPEVWIPPGELRDQRGVRLLDQHRRAVVGRARWGHPEGRLGRSPAGEHRRALRGGGRLLHRGSRTAPVRGR